mgnify:CR=1 FL=1
MRKLLTLLLLLMLLLTSSAMAACKYYTRMDSVCQTMCAAGLRFFQSRLCCFPVAFFRKKLYDKYNSSPVQK